MKRARERVRASRMAKGWEVGRKVRQIKNEIMIQAGVRKVT